MAAKSRPKPKPKRKRRKGRPCPPRTASARRRRRAKRRGCVPAATPRRPRATKPATAKPRPTAPQGPAPIPPAPPAPPAAAPVPSPTATPPPPAGTPAPVPSPTAKPPAPSPTPTATPAATATPAPTATPTPVPPADPVAPGLPVYTGPFGRRQAERLLWRAGFGPRPGDLERLVRLGLEAAVHELTRPTGDARLVGPEPSDEGEPLAPTDAWGHDHLYWLDRMVRSDQPLVERLALVLHDWFATSLDGVGSQRLMLEQTNLFRAHGLGNFRELVRAITADGAMLVFLDGVGNSRWGINENYARELMELFALGADRGAYTEGDVRELARALSGWRGTWTAEEGWHDFRWEEEAWDPGSKTVFGHAGRWTWEDAVRLVLDHPLHPSFVVRKLWGYFVAGPPPAATARALEALYVSTGGELRPLVEAILLSPELYEGDAMVKPPAVAAAGMLRALGGAVDHPFWWWTAPDAGQRLYFPPDVAGWRDERWLDTSTTRGRWTVVAWLLSSRALDPGRPYPAETAEAAVAGALAFWGDPALADDTRAALVRWAAAAVRPGAHPSLHPQRQNALRQLIGASPDLQTS